MYSTALPFRVQGVPDGARNRGNRNFPADPDEIKRAEGPSSIENKGGEKMSEVTVMCPYCEASLTGDSDFLGEEVGCPDCGNSFIARISPGSYGESEPGAESVSASLKRFRFNPEAFKNIGAMSAAESYKEQQDPNDSVFTDTERGVKRPAAYRRQNPHKSGFPAPENRTSRPAAYRRQAESFARPSHAAASVPPAKRSIPATGR